MSLSLIGLLASVDVKQQKLCQMNIRNTAFSLASDLVQAKNKNKIKIKIPLKSQAMINNEHFFITSLPFARNKRCLQNQAVLLQVSRRSLPVGRGPHRHAPPPGQVGADGGDLLQAFDLALQEALKVTPHLHLLDVGLMVLAHHLLALAQVAAQVFLLLDFARVDLPAKHRQQQTLKFGCKTKLRELG